MLITTKQGEAGKIRINFNSTHGIQRMSDYPVAITNSVDNLILLNEAALVAGTPIPYPDYEKYTGEDPNYQAWITGIWYSDKTLQCQGIICLLMVDPTSSNFVFQVQLFHRKTYGGNWIRKTLPATKDIILEQILQLNFTMDL